LQEGSVGREEVEARGVVAAKGGDGPLWKGVAGPQRQQILFLVGPQAVLQNGHQQAMDADDHQRRRVIQPPEAAGIAQQRFQPDGFGRSRQRLCRHPRLEPQVKGWVFGHSMASRSL